MMSQTDLLLVYYLVCQLQLEYRNSRENRKIGLPRFFPVFGRCLTSLPTSVKQSLAFNAESLLSIRVSAVPYLIDSELSRRVLWCFSLCLFSSRSLFLHAYRRMSKTGLSRLSGCNVSLEFRLACSTKRFVLLGSQRGPGQCTHCRLRIEPLKGRNVISRLKSKKELSPQKQTTTRSCKPDHAAAR